MNQRAKQIRRVSTRRSRTLVSTSIAPILPAEFRVNIPQSRVIGNFDLVIADNPVSGNSSETIGLSLLTNYR